MIVAFQFFNHNQAFKPEYKPKDNVGRDQKGGDSDNDSH